MIAVTPSVYRPGDRSTDFAWMIEHAPWDRSALFVFNDNLRQSAAFLDAAEAGRVADGAACAAGGGNATVRPYQCGSPPRAAGVPTGPGFERLDGVAREAIDRALGHVERLLATGRYAEVIYSADPAQPALLGHSIFRVPDDVRAYVPVRLHALVDRANAP